MYLLSVDCGLLVVDFALAVLQLLFIYFLIFIQMASCLTIDPLSKLNYIRLIYMLNMPTPFNWSLRNIKIHICININVLRIRSQRALKTK